jgi:hypothetical protein
MPGRIILDRAATGGHPVVGDRQRAISEVNICPPQTRNLTAPQAAQSQLPRVPDPVVGNAAQ